MGPRWKQWQLLGEMAQTKEVGKWVLESEILDVWLKEPPERLLNLGETLK